jgi:hypothetical protein
MIIDIEKLKDELIIHSHSGERETRIVQAAKLYLAQRMIATANGDTTPPNKTIPTESLNTSDPRLRTGETK